MCFRNQCHEYFNALLIWSRCPEANQNSAEACESQMRCTDGARAAHVYQVSCCVQDGHFVDNLSIGPPVVSSLRKHSEEAFLDCHLMVSEPAKWVQVGLLLQADATTAEADPTERSCTLSWSWPQVSHQSLLGARPWAFQLACIWQI